METDALTSKVSEWEDTTGFKDQVRAIEEEVVEMEVVEEEVEEKELLGKEGGGKMNG